MRYRRRRVSSSASSGSRRVRFGSPLSWILAIQAGFLALVVVLAHYARVRFAWATLWPALWADLLVWMAWAWTAWRQVPARQVWLVLGLLMAFGHLTSVAQYVLLAQHRPMTDAFLVGVDRALGISVSELATWLRAHPSLVLIEQITYGMFFPELLAVPLVLGLWFRDERAVWEYAFHFHVILTIALLWFWLWPARAPFLHPGAPFLMHADLYREQFEGFAAGQLSLVRFDRLTGLISMPSLHVAGGWLCTWSCRRRPVLGGSLLLLNLALSAATLMLGIHYAADLLGTVLVCGISLWLYRFVAGAAFQPPD